MAVAGSPRSVVYLQGGERAARAIWDILAANGIAIADSGRILDFGCGCGRVLRHWKNTLAEVHGTDYNPALVQWSAENLPFARVRVNEAQPPTSYEPASFDLVYALSVFTHLPRALQLHWMDEFRRILKPGGSLILSLHGEFYLPRLTEEERSAFLAGQLVMRDAGGAGSNLCNAFHPTSWVRDELARGFDVLSFVPEGALGNPRQDLWLLRRR